MTPPRLALVASLAPSHPPDYPDVDNRICQLLGPTALVVQALMGIGVIATLLYKRQREKPRRKWRVWVFDVSKQIIGQIVVHFSNIGISDWISHVSVNNACVTYFLNILVDTTIGVGLIYVLLWGSTKVLTDYFELPGFKSGQYGDGPKLSLPYWGRQAAVYVACLLVMKLAVVGLFAAWPYIFTIGEWLLSWTGSSDWVQVTVVMGLCPIFLNMLQFWLIDSIVKASDSLGLTYALTPPVDESQEPLFMNEPDSEGEDGPVRQSVDLELELERGYTSPTKRATATTHSRALSPSSFSGGLDKKLAASKLDESERSASGKNRTSVEFQQPSACRRSPPRSPHYGATGESPTGWGGFEDDPDWDGEQDGVAWGGAGKRRSPKLRRSLSVGRRKDSGGSGSWRLDTITPSNPSGEQDQDQAI